MLIESYNSVIVVGTQVFRVKRDFDMPFAGRCKRTFRKIAVVGSILTSSLMPLKSTNAKEGERNEPIRESPIAVEEPEDAGSAWIAVRPGYVTGDNQLLIRTEGGASSVHGTRFYGFVDMQPSEQDSAAINSFYGELRLSQDVPRGLAIYGELNAGTGIDPVFRPGLLYNLSTGGWNIQLRLSPISFGGVQDVQLAFYTSTTFAGRISFEALFDVNFRLGSIYYETAADINIGAGFSVGLQIRGFSVLEDRTNDIQPVIRLSFSH